MQAVWSLLALAAIFYGYVRWQRFRWKVSDKVERRVVQGTVLREQRVVGKALAEGWSIAFGGTPTEAIDHFLNHFADSSYVIKRLSATAVTLAFQYGTKSFLYDTRELLLCRINAASRGEATVVSFSVEKNPMTTITNERARQVSAAARRAFG